MSVTSSISHLMGPSPMTVVLPDNWLREVHEEATIFCVKSVAVGMIEKDAPASMTIGNSETSDER